MINRLTVSLYGLMFLSFFSLTGCPTPTAPKSDVSSSSGKSAVSESTTREQSSTSSSSLESHRRGETSTTPASSPLKDIHFAYDRYNLREDARATLRAGADWLKSHPSARVEIEGHCDERGTNEYNLALGAKRAQSAMDYLISLGISARQLSTVSYGEELPTCREKTKGCWQKNRRDRFIVTMRPTS